MQIVELLSISIIGSFTKRQISNAVANEETTAKTILLVYRENA